MRDGGSSLWGGEACMRGFGLLLARLLHNSRVETLLIGDMLRMLR